MPRWRQTSFWGDYLVGRDRGVADRDAEVEAVGEGAVVIDLRTRRRRR